MRLFIEKVIGSHPKQFRVDPPTTVICFEQGINCSLLIFSSRNCSVPAKQMLAPLSGKTLQLDGGFCCKRGNDGEIDTLIRSSIAWTMLIARESSVFLG